MTRTHRKRGTRLDVYLTPPWVLAQLLDQVVPIGATPVGVFGGDLWLEPSCGERHICRAVGAWCQTRGVAAPVWTTVDVRREVRPHLCGDFRRRPGAVGAGVRWSAAVGNPPFSQALEFVQVALGCCDVVAFLLRSNWLGTRGRNEWIRRHIPWQGYVSARIQFIGARGKSGDSEEYSWFIWDQRPDPVFEPGRLVVFPYAEPGYRERWAEALAA